MHLRTVQARATRFKHALRLFKWYSQFGRTHRRQAMRQFSDCTTK